MFRLRSLQHNLVDVSDPNTSHICSVFMVGCAHASALLRNGCDQFNDLFNVFSCVSRFVHDGSCFV